MNGVISITYINPETGDYEVEREYYDSFYTPEKIVADYVVSGLEVVSWNRWQ